MVEDTRTVNGRAATLSAIFRDPGGFKIPLFQRGYSWKAQHVERLLADLWEAHVTNTPHFLGSIVTQRQGGHGPYNLIDGQQRWTTLNLVLLALKEMFVLGDDTATAQNFDRSLKAKVVRNDCELCCSSSCDIHAERSSCRILIMPDAKTSDPCWQ